MMPRLAQTKTGQIPGGRDRESPVKAPYVYMDTPKSGKCQAARALPERGEHRGRGDAPEKSGASFALILIICVPNADRCDIIPSLPDRRGAYGRLRKGCRPVAAKQIRTDAELAEALVQAFQQRRCRRIEGDGVRRHGGRNHSTSRH